MELLPYLADIIAICILVFAVYLPRHHRRDLAVAYLGVNIGVMAVSIVLVNSAAAAGLGLGLFGVLSIIRLRSDELAQHEVVYYFSALALGLLGGLGGPITTYALMGLIVAVLAVVDTSRFRRGARREVVNLDRAITDPEELRYELATRLGGRVLGVNVQRLDFVTDSTLVEVRYAPGAALPAAELPIADEMEVLR
ncbi:DUF4956 domain-containing protein [Arachnia rubra]|jgi:hypothetical protein|uniref:DUF4956 domain-containing protein n=1 Tax=Arachnia rubra TaxID=1547448 RepID=A0ABX7Y1H2_9ACTN|nr:DUF4956 domain-containing protein [Arachnia rubra]MBB1575746.1 DUF4956 domain-containing protein [Propionibacterium sp.]MDO4644430.1 DUF4956 domain-containing protein [Propionibacteriaceae bacterium]QUC06932.1 DUF4956 domain-containing protein [Arachnia rubra]BCR81154.1 DUF4956 domain-containing protein [Arachnia rubra]